MSREGVKYFGADLGVLAGAGLASLICNSSTMGLCRVLSDALGSVCASHTDALRLIGAMA